MSLSATYESTTSFTVSTDKTSDFIQGRALRMDCGADGIKYGYVSYSSYSSPNTTIYLESTDSQAITSNLASVDFARVTCQESGGNAPLQVVWMERGFKSGLTLSWKDADEIYIDSGALHIDNGTAENIYCAQSQITKQLTSLSASTWYAIYVDPPDNGLNLVATDIEYASVSSAPTYDQAKRGWYHPTNTDWRCIGFIYSNASSNIESFSVTRDLWHFNGSSLVSVNGTTPSNTFTDGTAGIPIGDITAWLFVVSYYINANAKLLLRKNGDAGAGMDGPYCHSNNISGRTYMAVPVDSSKVFEYKYDVVTASNPAYINTAGFFIPKGM